MPQAIFVLLALFLFSSCKSTNSQMKADPPLSSQGFVQVQNGQLMLDGGKFRFFGSNFYRLALADAFGAQVVRQNVSGKVQYPQIDKVMENYAQLGVKVVRLWTFACEGSRGSRVSPSIIKKDFSLDPEGLSQLDYTVAAAGRHGIKLIFPLVNFEHEYCGMEWWVEQSYAAAPEKDRGTIQYSCIDQKSHRLLKLAKSPNDCPAEYPAVPSKELFYTQSIVKDRFKTYVKTMLDRANIYTGVSLKNDPTIMAIGLSNEPHTSDYYECLLSNVGGITDEDCRKFDRQSYQKFAPGTIVYNWLTEMSQYVKSIDSNHLVSTGEEAYRTSHDDASCLDRHQWIHDGSKGVDFARNSSIPSVDLMSTHLYPDNWAVPASELDWFDRCIIRDRARLAAKNGKVIYLEESGFSETAYPGKPDDYRRERAHYLSRMFAYANRAGFQGTMVWQAAPLTLNDQVAEDDSFTFPILTKENGKDVYSPEGRAVMQEVACQSEISRTGKWEGCVGICPSGTSVDGQGRGKWSDGTPCILTAASSGSSGAGAVEYPLCPNGTTVKDGWGWVKDAGSCEASSTTRAQYKSQGGCSCRAQ